MGRLIRNGALCVIAAGVLACVASAVPAYALSPWWHLVSTSRPTYLQVGAAKDEIQELTVSATEGVYLLEGIDGERVVLSADEAPQEAQEGFEEIYGSGNVEVTGGPGPEPGIEYGAYQIKFIGARADERVEPLRVGRELLTYQEEEEPPTGKATLKEVVKGRADGQILVTATNLGDEYANPATNPITIADALPAGLEAVAIEGEADEEYFRVSGTNPMECTLGTLTCTFTGTKGSDERVAPYEQIQVRITVKVKAGAKSGEVNEASITGGEAPNATAKQSIAVNGAAVPFGANVYEIRPEEEGGNVDTQAGSHPFQLTTTILFNEGIEGEPIALAKDLHFKLPAGLIGNPSPFAQCPLQDFLEDAKCTTPTTLGVARVNIRVVSQGRYRIAPWVAPIYNLTPAVGEPARFGFMVERVPVILDTAVRTGEDYGVTVNVTNVSQTAEFVGSEVTFWGVPGDSRHDGARNECLAAGKDERPESCIVEGVHPPPFLTLPTSCTGTLHTTVEADSWKQPTLVESLTNTDVMPALDGCNRLQSSPSIEVAPDSQAGSTPTGLAVSVHVPQEVSLDPEGLAEADVKNTTVALPAGVAINPAGADGLQACSEEQIGLKNAEIPTCPDASKVGLVKIKTPLLPNDLEGSAYLAAQNANPFGSLVAIYVFVEDPISGSRVKLAGEVVPNPVTGQLVSTFKNTPQLPFETFELHFFGGDRAPLASPARCGAYTTTAAIEPWTESGEVDSSSTFDIASGPASFNEPAGQSCPGTRLPFAPSLNGGATNINAGAFSPLTLTFSRKDGEQNIQSVEAHLPPGLSGILSNIELCPEPQANLGECGPNSLIGETTVSVGVGGDPFAVGGGKFYLTGPYNGSGSCTVGTPGCAPFGITFEVPAKAGPFDLKRNTANPASEDPCDCVIVRGKIEVNPINAAITITSDPPGSPYAIPTSIEGIPLEIQHINATTTRGDFQFNPTNCEKMQATGTIHSSENTTFNVSVPFQVTNCAILAFKPGFKVSTSGKTSRAKGASLNVKLTYPKAPFGSQANIKSVKVDLPKRLPSRLTTLQKACTSGQFESNPAGCPADSIVGHATAITPLIPVPLTGPAYFVSYGGAKFPELVIALQGYGVTLDLHGETFINKAGITSSTFHTVPDAPVGSFELNLPEGKYSALAANGNLCQTKLTMPTAFTAQNGATIKQNTPITVTGCAKAKKAKTKRKHKAAAHKGSAHGKR
ncbi:MAG TPA: hypothetical protein VIJ39_05745 [Solirubrobacteraceae bacterium]